MRLYLFSFSNNINFRRAKNDFRRALRLGLSVAAKKLILLNTSLQESGGKIFCFLATSVPLLLPVCWAKEEGPKWPKNETLSPNGRVQRKPRYILLYFRFQEKEDSQERERNGGGESRYRSRMVRKKKEMVVGIGIEVRWKRIMLRWTSAREKWDGEALC